MLSTNSFNQIKKYGLGLILGIIFFLSHTALLNAAQPPPPRCDWSDQTYDDFYTYPLSGTQTTVDPNTLGQIVRLEHIRSYSPQEVAEAANLASSPHGAEAYRMLYLSQGPLDTAQVVSGLIIVPSATPPAEGFPVFAFGHGTVGLADVCAPSKLTTSLEGLLTWVAHGYLISATDYQGLGVEGLHPYLVGDVAGYSMLDSVRAALNFCDSAYNLETPAANQIILAGYSQGGQSALFAHEAWPSYAPALNLLGTVGFAPGSEPKYLARQTANSTFSPRVVPLSLAMYAYSQYYGAPPNLQAWLLEPYASDIGLQAESQCLAGLTVWLGLRPEQVFQPELISALQDEDWDAIQPWADYMDLNTPGNYSSNVPVLLLQGKNDPIVPPTASELLTERLCNNNTPTVLKQFPGVGHTNLVQQVMPSAVAWMKARLNGAPLNGACFDGEGEADPLIERTLEPVLIKGADVKRFTHIPIDELFVYAYKNNSWQQIPFQIDERAGNNLYVSAENNIFDSNDELVFMAKDMGLQVPLTGTGTLPGTIFMDEALYEIKLTDPLKPGQSSWAYLRHMPGETISFNTDYVGFNSGLHRITSPNYRFGLSATHMGADYLALGTDTVDILDRTKIRIACNIPGLCPRTESLLPPVPDNLIKDGPVRVILRDGLIIAYGSMLKWISSYNITFSPVRFSMDFNQFASGSVFYNGVTAQGVTVDGMPDFLLNEPFSQWWQLSASSGTLIHVLNSATLNGELVNYYQDEATFEATDTGDRLRFGESGVKLNNPRPGSSYEYTLYLLPDAHPNVGTTYTAFFNNPLNVSISPRGEFGAELIFLPLILKN